MIRLDIRLDPGSGLYQFKIDYKGVLHWSRPMPILSIEKIARFFYKKALAEGKVQQNKPYILAHEEIAALINKGTFTIQRSPATARALRQAQSKKDRIAQELRWAKIKTQDVDQLLEELGL